MKKILLFILMIFLLSSFIMADDWTFMVYMDGDCNLEPEAIDDFLEMSAVGSTADINIIVIFDRHPNYSSSYGDWTGTLGFRITSGMTPISGSAIKDFGEMNMGDPATLTNFVNWAVNNYPASNYILVLWDHGGPGWRSKTKIKTKKEKNEVVKSVCYDESSSDDCLYNKEVATALTQIKMTLGKKLEIMGYDACLMGMMEVAYSIRNFADIAVFSEENEPGDGWPYTPILNYLKNTPSASPADLAKKIVYEYGLGSEGYGMGSSTTLSAVDLTKIDALTTSVSTFANSMQKEWAHIKSAREKTLEFNPLDFIFKHHIDLYSFASKIDIFCNDPDVKNNADDVKNKITSAVITNFSGGSLTEAKGISIYFRGLFLDSDYNSTNISFASNTQWDEFLSAYFSADKASPSEPTLLDPGSTNISGIYQVTWNKSSSGDTAFYQYREIDQYPVYVLNDNMESGLGNWNNLGFLWSSSRYYSSSYSLYSGNGNNLTNSITYNNPITLGNNPELSFWTYYYIESGYDFGGVQISEDNINWITLEYFTGLQSSWTNLTYDLEGYSNKTIYLRFFYTTDYSVFYDGFYVDDIQIRQEGNILRNNITTSTSLSITNFTTGNYYYRIRAFDNVSNRSIWGDCESIYVSYSPPNLISPSVVCLGGKTNNLTVKGKSSDLMVFTCTYQDDENDKPGLISANITNSIFLVIKTNQKLYGYLEIKTNSVSLNYKAGVPFTFNVTGEQTNIFHDITGTVLLTNSFKNLFAVHGTNLRYQFAARPVTGATQTNGFTYQPDSLWQNLPQIIIDDTPPALPTQFSNIIDSYYGNAIESTWTITSSQDIASYRAVTCTNTNLSSKTTNNTGILTNTLFTNLRSYKLYYTRLYLYDDVNNISQTPWKTNRTLNALPQLYNLQAEAIVEDNLSVKGKSSDIFTFRATYSDMEGDFPGWFPADSTNRLFLCIATNGYFYGAITMSHPAEPVNYTNGVEFTSAIAGNNATIFYKNNGDAMTNTLNDLFSSCPNQIKYNIFTHAVTGNTNILYGPSTNWVNMPSITIDDTAPETSTITIAELSEKSAKIIWTPSPSSDIASYVLLYGTTTDYESTSSALSSSTVFYNATGLDSNTTYHYKLEYTDDVGNTSEKLGSFKTEQGLESKAFAYPSIMPKGGTVKFHYVAENSEIRIYNVVGDLIITIENSNPKQWKPHSDIASGIYIAVYKDQKGNISTAKFIYGIKR